MTTRPTASRLRTMTLEPRARSEAAAGDASEASASGARGARDPLIGALLHGRYRVERRVGKGGMGVVYLAEHVLLRRKVAIKVLHSPALGSDEHAERFLREAMAAAKVGSEHVVGVTDMGQLEDGSHFLVLEYLDGIELAAAVALEGRFSVRRATEVALQLCDALSAVHAADIVHRDLKPENVFLIERAGRRDFVKVLDFGICKVRDDGPAARRLTDTGIALGTPQFMAPEQVEGRPDIDHRADVYAVGGILFFMLAGAEPFNAPSLPRLFVQICEDPPPQLCALRPDVPDGLASVVARALEKSPERRFQTSEELAAALRPFAEHDEARPSHAAEGSAPASEPLHAPSLGSPALPAAGEPALASPSIAWSTGALELPGRRVWPRRVTVGVLACMAAAAALGQAARSGRAPRGHVAPRSGVVMERARPETARLSHGSQPNVALASERGPASPAAPAERTEARESPPASDRATPAGAAPRHGSPPRGRAQLPPRTTTLAVLSDRAPQAASSPPPASASPENGPALAPSAEATDPAPAPGSSPGTPGEQAWPAPRKLKHVF